MGSNPPTGASKHLAETPTAISFDEQKLFWAMRDLAASEAIKHFFICGMAGSGKTTVIQLFLQSVARRFSQGRAQPEQLIIFDAKGDMVPALAGMGLRPEDDNVWILNPYDARGAIWNLAEAVQTPTSARHLAEQLVPKNQSSGAPFFSEAARKLVFSVIIALNHIAGSRWTLRDLLCALDSLPSIRAVTARHPKAKATATSVLDDETHAPGVLSALASSVSCFEEIAALWDKVKRSRRFSMSEFLTKPGVLVLGNDPVHWKSLAPLNATLLRALTNEILGRPNTSSPRHWFVFDEIRMMGQVDSVHDLLNWGRSKGVSVLIGAQSVEGLMATCGEHAANEIIGHCEHKTFLRVGGPKCAEWAEQFFGHRTNVLLEWRGENGQVFSVKYHVHKHPIFPAAFFQNLPSPAVGHPFISVNDIPSLDATLLSRVPFDQLLAWRKPPAADIPGVVPLSGAESLRPWSDEEGRFFGGGEI